MYTDSAASVHETEKEPMAETADSDYRLVEKSEIPDDEKDMPALAKAFRILSDCDIYEKNRSNLTNLLYLPIYGIMMNVKL